MTTNYHLFLILIQFTLIIKAQTTFSDPILISSQLDVATSVFACDIDNDGDNDVISASYFDNKIAWYENTDGNGTFSTQKIISNTAGGASSVFACDIDGDNDNDVLSASWTGNKIVWYENIDGFGQFGSQQIISLQTNGAHRVHSEDLDGDGDNDVLSASYYDNKIAWYENYGNGNFSQQRIISTSVMDALSVYAIDLDGDYDCDVLSASRTDNKIAWYENIDGAGLFGQQKIISVSAHGAFCVYACDIDGDGDNDVLSASEYDDKVAWYENIDGNGNFSSQQIISATAGGAEVVYAGDIDNDGDFDVLSACYWDNKIAWYENTDGTGTFGAEQTIWTAQHGAFSVFACDIDGDSDNDVLAAWGGGNRIEWYRNDLIPATKVEAKKSKFQIKELTNYPNPFNPRTTIIYSIPKTMFIKLSIFDLLGREIMTLLNEKQHPGKYEVDFNAGGLASGIYYYILQTDLYTEAKKMILLR